MPYIVQTAACTPSATCWGIYRRVAVLEVEPGVTRVAMISERARGVRRIVSVQNNLHVGKTSRCAYQRALKAARAEMERLNLLERRPPTPEPLPEAPVPELPVTP